MSGARVSFLVLGGRPAVVVDVAGDGHTGPLNADDDPVVWSFTSRGLALLPAFLGQAVPETDQLLLAAGHGRLALATPEEVDVLSVPLEELPDGWFDAADEHEGALVLVGRDLDVADLGDESSIARRLDAAATEARLLGAAVDLD